MDLQADFPIRSDLSFAFNAFFVTIINLAVSTDYFPILWMRKLGQSHLLGVILYSFALV